MISAETLGGRRDVARNAASMLSGRRAHERDTARASRDQPAWLTALLARPELLQPPLAIIPRLAFPGRVTLLSAREKMGKSTLVSQAIAALTRGGAFLGDQLQSATALWYAIDEPLGDLVQRLVRDQADPQRIAISTTPPSAHDVRNDLEATGARLVVVDTLRELFAGEVEENDAGEVAAFLRPYVDVMRERDVALILLHNTGKSGGSYRGSSHLGAAVDVILTLRGGAGASISNDGESDLTTDDGRRSLTGVGRNVRVRERLSFDGTHYRLGDAPLALRERVLAVLACGPSSGTELARNLRTRKQDV